MVEVRYTKDHEYIALDGETGAVGITNYAQEKLGDVTFVELPLEGKSVKQGDAVGVVESVKAASDIYTPVSGTIIALNSALNDNPELINQDAEGGAWLYKIKLGDVSEFNTLMDRDAYLAFAKEEG